MVEKRTEKKSSKARARLCVCAHTSCTVVGGLHSGLGNNWGEKIKKFDLIL